jgi:MFS family permease
MGDNRLVTTAEVARSERASGATLVLLTLAAGQFLMTLDSSVMNVSIATVAKDVGTTVTGIQGAITAYTLVMAALMITGAKIGAMIGRKRAFAIGCVIYGCGSFTTSIAQSLPVAVRDLGHEPLGGPARFARRGATRAPGATGS